MTDNVISLLQGVKQAEEAKARAIETARTEAAARIKAAEEAARRVPEEVKTLLTAEEPRIRTEVEAATRNEMTALETWSQAKLQALKAAADKNGDRVLTEACRRFLKEWEA